MSNLGFIFHSLASLKQDYIIYYVIMCLYATPFLAFRVKRPV